MKIYDETGALLTGEPDLTLGYVTQEQRVAAHHKAVAEKSRLEVMEGTQGLRRRVVDRPARPAWDEYETVGVYHPYSDAELAAQGAPTAEDRLSACEAAIMELAELAAGGV